MKPQQPSNRIAITKGAKSAPKGKDNNKFIYILFPFGRRFLCLNKNYMERINWTAEMNRTGTLAANELAKPTLPSSSHPSPDWNWEMNRSGTVVAGASMRTKAAVEGVYAA